MRLTTEEIAAATGGRVFGPTVVVQGMSHDSRRVQPGQLFVALRGARDGNEFVQDAFRGGAAAYLTESEPVGDGASFPCVRVTDALAAIGALAVSVRARVGRVIAITGSVGKTTTKDLASAVLASRYQTHASPESFNNAIGVPHTFLNAPDGTEMLVVEVGANAPGEIRDLCRIARPDVGIVTRVAPAHTEGFGSLAAVQAAKAELVESLPAAGVAILNGDDPLVAAMAGRTEATVMVFGRHGDVRAELLDVDGELRPRLRFATPWGDFEVRLAVRGAHQAVNAAAAVTAGGLHGVPLEEIQRALATANASGRRMDLQIGRGGLRVLDDSYNANPASVEAALRALVTMPARRRVAVLGHMAELGDLEAEEHHRIGELTRELGVEALSVQAPAYGVADFGSVEQVIGVVADLGDGDVILVKGSRVAGLDSLAARLRDDATLPSSTAH
ncbi:MAG: UDP-N-acetylmuramoyl-tripeptide--D-alanyl-D-alanine ligase [Acidimicrobiales bacterium]